MTSIKQFFATAPVNTRSFSVNGIGVREPMQPSMPNRPAGTGDWLFMHFHDPVTVNTSVGERRVPGNTLMIWEPGMPQRYGNTDTPYLHSWIHCDGQMVGDVTKRAGLESMTPFHDVDTNGFEQQLEALFRELTGPWPADTIVASNLFENAVRILGRGLRNAGEQIPARIQAIRQHIDGAYSTPLNLAELAAIAHLSIPHLCSEFKRCYGCSVIAYAIRQRIAEARFLLHDRSLSVADVGSRVGYDDIYYFSRLFKKHTGMSPTAMRRSYERDGGLRHG